MVKYIYFLLVLLSLSCGNKKMNTNKEKNSKETITNKINNNLYDIWLLKKINQKDVDFKRQIILELNTKDLLASGNANCNTFSGKMKTTDNKISFEDIISTQMACQELNQEQLYFGLLQNVRTFQLKNMHLLLFDKNNNLILEYQKVD